MRTLITTSVVAILLASPAMVDANPGCPSCKASTSGKAVVAKAKAQTTCPVMKGGKIKKNLYADVKGKRIYVCCPGCIGKIKADPGKYIKQLEKAGVTLATTPKMKAGDARK